MIWFASTPYGSSQTGVLSFEGNVFDPVWEQIRQSRLVDSGQGSCDSLQYLLGFELQMSAREKTT